MYHQKLFQLPVAAVAISLRYASAASFFRGFCSDRLWS